MSQALKTKLVKIARYKRRAISILAKRYDFSPNYMKSLVYTTDRYKKEFLKEIDKLENV